MTLKLFILTFALLTGNCSFTIVKGARLHQSFQMTMDSSNFIGYHWNMSRIKNSSCRCFQQNSTPHFSKSVAQGNISIQFSHEENSHNKIFDKTQVKRKDEKVTLSLHVTMKNVVTANHEKLEVNDKLASAVNVYVVPSDGSSSGIECVRKTYNSECQ